MSSMSISSPSGVQEAYFVSHQLHRRLQPEVRTKTEGTPVNSPSPWMEKKISETNIARRKGSTAPRTLVDIVLVLPSSSSSMNLCQRSDPTVQAKGAHWEPFEALCVGAVLSRTRTTTIAK